MGFFDKLINGLKSEIQSEIKKQIDSALNNSNDEPVINTTPSTTMSFENIYANEYNTDEAYFANIITQDKFPDYTIEKSVHPKVFDSTAHPKCYPISYLFKKEGEPVLAVLLMNTNQYKAMIAVGTYEILDNNNIKYIRFFKGMKNEKSYVINRIKENL